MNRSDQRHPSFEELSRYQLGKLNAVQAEAIESHVAACDECARVVGSVPGNCLQDSSAHAANSGDVANARRSGDANSVAERSDNSPQSTKLIPYETATVFPPVSAPTQRDESIISLLNLPPELRQHSRYHIQHCLGSGGMGTVYKAQHRLMNRLVALKVIKPQLIEHPGSVERFRREVQAAARLSHPNIVTAYDADQAGGLHFLVMEYVEGVDLDQVLQAGGQLEVDEACDYIRQVACGLQHAHEQGMVHRDIKPHNLMLAIASRRIADSLALPVKQQAVIKILDFGLASFAGDTNSLESEAGGHSHIADLQLLTGMGAMMGTPDYIAPEQATDAHTADIRADIYSLGCTFYFLLTGHPPFTGGTIQDKIRAHLEKSPLPICQFRDDVPPVVEEILQRMLAKAPIDRYQRPQDVADALSRCLGSRVTSRTSSLIPGKRYSRQVPVALLKNQGTLEIRSEVKDVNLVVTRGDVAIEFGLEPGSIRRRLPSGQYHVKLASDRHDLHLNRDRFVLGRLGRVVVTITRKARNELISPPIIVPITTSPELVATWRGHRAGSDHSEWETASAIRAVAIASDGKMLVSGGADGVIILRQIPGDQEVVRIQAHSDLGVSPRGLALSDDGELLLSGGRDQMLAIWEIASHRELRRIRGGGETCGCFIPGTHRIVYRKQGHQLAIWDADTGQEIAARDVPFMIDKVTVSADGLWATTTHVAGNKVWIWDLQILQPLQFVESTANTVALSPDKGRLFLACRKGGKRGELWSLESQTFVPTFAPTNDLDALDAHFTSDGRFILTVGWGGTIKVRIQDASTGDIVVDLIHESANGTTNLAVSQDRRLAATAGTDGSVHLWQLPRSSSLNALSQQPAHSPTDDNFVTEVRRFEAHRDAGTRFGMALSADGNQLLSGGREDGQVCLWDVSTGDLLANFSLESRAPIIAVALSGDALSGVACDADGLIRVARLNSNHRVIQTHSWRSTAKVTALALFRDGKHLIYADQECGVIHCDMNGEILNTFAVPGGITEICLVSGNQAVIAGSNQCWLCDLQTGESELWDVPGISSMSVSTDGAQLLTGHFSGEIIQWDCASRRKVRNFLGHGGEVGRVYFLGDENHLISGGIDGSVRIWEVASGLEISRLDELGHFALTVRPSPDGQHAFSFGGLVTTVKNPAPQEIDFAIRLWRLPKIVKSH